MSAQNSQGIQTLLEAERKAHVIVQNARQYRAQRLKAAKVDAAKEIEDYKSAKQAEFDKNQTENSGTSSKEQQNADEHVSKELADIKQKSSSSRAKVVDKLIEAVTKPMPTLHINA